MQETQTMEIVMARMQNERTCNAHTWNWKAHASKSQAPSTMAPVPIGNLQLQTWLSACTGRQWHPHWSQRYSAIRQHLETCTPQHQSWRCSHATQTLGRTTPLGCCSGNLQGFKVQVPVTIHALKTNVKKHKLKKPSNSHSCTAHWNRMRAAATKTPRGYHLAPTSTRRGLRMVDLELSSPGSLMPELMRRIHKICNNNCHDARCKIESKSPFSSTPCR